MKKLILTSALVLAFFGCSPEDAEIDTSNNCNCGVITEVSRLTLPSGELVTTLRIRNNCTDQISTIGLNGHVGVVGEQYCNN